MPKLALKLMNVRIENRRHNSKRIIHFNGNQKSLCGLNSIDRVQLCEKVSDACLERSRCSSKSNWKVYEQKKTENKKQLSTALVLLLWFTLASSTSSFTMPKAVWLEHTFSANKCTLQNGMKGECVCVCVRAREKRKYATTTTATTTRKKKCRTWVLWLNSIQWGTKSTIERRVC